ncbi:hypothetical protein [Pararhodospirillum oryzae]|uniref:Uncharacterized protein n=1 Tax=Pararhodospirillum oryzae TaxID=478448 RepID=A0A512H4Z8_9PROT|nr:hypothetical protein [Pararhodospirillum oryzae]GEO80542.1 hypothetical protein ROR02_06730 [Pararhodospirillum oryzae]
MHTPSSPFSPFPFRFFPRPRAAGLLLGGVLLLSACLDGPTIRIATHPLRDQETGSGPSCVARLVIENQGSQTLDAFQVSFGYYRDPEGKDQLASLEGSGLAPGASRTVEGPVAPAACWAVELMRDPVVSLCRRGSDDCRNAVTLKKAS